MKTDNYDSFDEELRSRALGEDCTLPDGFDERISNNLGMLPEKKSPRVIHVVRYALIAAALCALLTVTAFATGVMRFKVENGMAILGRFSSGIVFDENLRDYYGNNIAACLEQGASVVINEEGVKAIVPTQTNGVELSVEDGRFILYYQCGEVKGSVDMTEDIRQNGGFKKNISEGGYRMNITVYPAEPDDGTEFEGNFYRVKGDAHYPPGFTGTSSFTFDVPNKAAGNCYMKVKPIH